MGVIRDAAVRAGFNAVVDDAWFDNELRRFRDVRSHSSSSIDSAMETRLAETFVPIWTRWTSNPRALKRTEWELPAGRQRRDCVWVGNRGR